MTTPIDNPYSMMLETLAKGFEDLARIEEACAGIRKDLGETGEVQRAKAETYLSAASIVRSGL